MASSTNSVNGTSQAVQQQPQSSWAWGDAFKTAGKVALVGVAAVGAIALIAAGSNTTTNPGSELKKLLNDGTNWYQKAREKNKQDSFDPFRFPKGK